MYYYFRKNFANSLTLQCSPSSHSNIQTNNSSRPTAPQISSRAAELKAQLLARRAISANPPSNKSAANPGTSVNSNGTRQEKPQQHSSIRQSPHSPPAAEKGKPELNLNDLISQYSESKSTSDKKNDRDACHNKHDGAKTQDPILLQESEEKKSSLLRSTASQKQDAVTKSKVEMASNEKGCVGNADLDEPDMEPSEGEIIEEGKTNKTKDTKKSKETPGAKDFTRGDDKALRKPPFKQVKNMPLSSSPRDASMHHSQAATPQSQTQQNRESRQIEIDLRQEEKNHFVCPKSDYKQSANSEKHNQSRNDSRSEDFHRPEALLPANVGDYSRQRSAPLREREQRSANPPILDDILAYDTDLREWLEITGYHNKPYKDKILARRRAIAALDAQKEKLIAEIEAEERGGIPINKTQSLPLSMLPPPIPSYKSSERLGTVPLAATPSLLSHDRYQISSTSKRSFSQTQDPWIENGPGKMARIDVANYSVLAKDGQSTDGRRPRSSDQDFSNRNFSSRFDDTSRPYNNIRDQNYSPGFSGYEYKSPTRPRGYENDIYDDDEISESGSRSFESRGNNRGRIFESKNRGRGRGRGRGDIRDTRGSPESRNESSSGCKTANGRISKNSRGGSRGSRGN